MITDADVNKLKKTFATKNGVREDIRNLKEDLLDAMDRQKKEIKDDLLDAMDRQKKEIIESVAEVIRDGINPILDDHEGRIVKLEKRMPAIA